MDTYCDAWHSTSTDKVGLASSLLGNKLLDQERYSCDNRFVVLCIEVLSHQDSRRKRDLERYVIYLILYMYVCYIIIHKYCADAKRCFS